jgi:hypothetical protein
LPTAVGIERRRGLVKTYIHPKVLKQRVCHCIQPLIIKGFWRGRGFLEAKAAEAHGRILPLMEQERIRIDARKSERPRDVRTDLINLGVPYLRDGLLVNAGELDDFSTSALDANPGDGVALALQGDDGLGTIFW